MAGKKSPNPVDTHVGNRVRMRRMMLGFSQEKLGEALGVTFQQVQKYEKGLNRIGAGRLQTIAQVLQVPVAFFFEDAPGNTDTATGFAEDSGSSYVSDLLTTSDGLELTRAFLKISDTRVKRRIVELVKAIAETDE